MLQLGCQVGLLGHVYFAEYSGFTARFRSLQLLGDRETDALTITRQGLSSDCSLPKNMEVQHSMLLQVQLELMLSRDSLPWVSPARQPSVGWSFWDIALPAQ